MYIGIIAPTLERKHSPTKQRFELYHHVNTLSVCLHTHTHTHLSSIRSWLNSRLKRENKREKLNGIGGVWILDSLLALYLCLKIKHGGYKKGGMDARGGERESREEERREEERG